MRKVGIEFLKLTHWERYLLNRHISQLEQEAFSTSDMGDEDPGNDLNGRSNRRRHYRLDTSGMKLEVQVDFRPIHLRLYTAQLINLSPTGCCVLLPEERHIQVGARIPLLKIPAGKDTICCRAQVVYVSESKFQ
ncbi:PilZ domain-containing protein [bacterium]|nr:PilZ domain-containing protein [candidate division CSSED10-310 bacterium]